jgi:hypothetical protein
MTKSPGATGRPSRVIAATHGGRSEVNTLIELTGRNGDRVYLGTAHIVRVMPTDIGTRITSNFGSDAVHTIVKETASEVANLTYLSHVWLSNMRSED